MMDGKLPAIREANCNQTPEERLKFKPTAQRGSDSAKSESVSNSLVYFPAPPPARLFSSIS